MAVSSGLYGLTLEKFLIDTLGDSLEAEDNKVGMVTDTHTPNFDTHNFRDDITNEVSGAGYTAGGKAYTTTEVTLSSGTLKYDSDDVAWTGSTITSAEAAFLYRDTAAAATDELYLMSDFGSPASTSSGTFTIQWAAAGIFTIDYTP
jgi:hypothetical protein